MFPIKLCFHKFCPRSPLKWSMRLSSTPSARWPSVFTFLVWLDWGKYYSPTPLYEPPSVSRGRFAPHVQPCLFLGQERLFVSGGSLARGLFFPFFFNWTSSCIQKRRLPLHLAFSCFFVSSAKVPSGSATFKATSPHCCYMLRWVQRGHDNLVDFMDTSCSSEGVSAWAIKQEVTWDKCACSSRHWSAVGQFSTLKVSLLGFFLFYAHFGVGKGWNAKIWGEKNFFFMLSWVWMRENTFSGVTTMHCNVAHSSNNTDTYWLMRPKYYSSYTWKKISNTITSSNLNSPSGTLPWQLGILCFRFVTSSTFYDCQVMVRCL